MKHSNIFSFSYVFDQNSGSSRVFLTVGEIVLIIKIDQEILFQFFSFQTICVLFFFITVHWVKFCSCFVMLYNISSAKFLQKNCKKEVRFGSIFSTWLASDNFSCFLKLYLFIFVIYLISGFFNYLSAHINNIKLFTTKNLRNFHFLSSS